VKSENKKEIKTIYRLTGLFLFVVFIGFNYSCNSNDSVNEKEDPPVERVPEFWLSDNIQNIKFTKHTNSIESGVLSGYTTITINSAQTYQEIDGFGFSLTGGSALHIHNMSANARTELLTELFDHSENNIGVSYLRVSIGASDLDAEVFSYNDLPSGQTDPNMEHFSLSKDYDHLIPVLKEILQIYPDLKIMGSPWSAPTWMKTNNQSVGGSLKSEYYETYAKYFVKYIQEMANEGIIIAAITIQNEPLHDGNNPSMYMSAADQGKFVKNNLGPAFASAAINTKIIIYDHNADRTDYPISILNDTDAAQYIDGSAFHLYGGSIDDLSTLHNAHPDKNIYFTEQWIGAPGNFPEDLKWHVRELIVGATRNWCRNVIEWNLAADENQDPHTPGGCSMCLGALTIIGDNVVRNPAYYVIAHASKFVRPGSVRINSTSSSELPNVAFKNIDGSIVIVVLNDSGSEKIFNAAVDEFGFHSKLSAGAVGTYIYEAN